MAFPVDAARTSTNISTAATSHTINVGSPSAGDLLLVLVRFTGAPGTVTFSTYTLLTTDSSDASDDVTNVYYRLADGSEGASDPMSTVNSIKLAAVCWRVTGAISPATQPPQIGAAKTFTTFSNQLVGSLTLVPTGGAKDYLWFIVGGYDGEAGAPTATDGSFTNLVSANSGTGGAVATNCFSTGGSLQLNAANLDAGTAWTHPAAATGGVGFTVAVHPPSGSTYTKAGYAKESA